MILIESISFQYRYLIQYFPSIALHGKSVRMRSFSSPYSVQMWENTDQKNSKQGYFPRSIEIKETFAMKWVKAHQKINK